jgi:hypothetical protein
MHMDRKFNKVLHIVKPNYIEQNIFRDILGFKSYSRGEQQDDENSFYSELTGFFVIVSMLNDSLNKSEEFINEVHERCSAFY